MGTAVETDEVRRRRDVRSNQWGGTATCSTGTHTTHYRIVNASSSGIALDAGPRLLIGSSVGLRVWWPDVGAADAHGEVVRHCHGSQGRMALRFTDASERLETLVANLLRIEALRQSEPRTLLCGEDPWLIRAQEDLDDAGFAVIHATSALSAIRALQNPWNVITTVVIEPSVRWLEFSDFVHHEFPDLRRVLVAGPESSADLYLAQSKGIVDAGLQGPWHPGRLFGMLALPDTIRCLSCDRRSATSNPPFCAVCLDWSRDLGDNDDLGCCD